MAWVNGSSDTALQPLVRQLRDALRSAETELQRRCFISSEISEALASADAYLGGRARRCARLDCIFFSRARTPIDPTRLSTREIITIRIIRSRCRLAS